MQESLFSLEIPEFFQFDLTDTQWAETLLDRFGLPFVMNLK